MDRMIRSHIAIVPLSTATPSARSMGAEVRLCVKGMGVTGYSDRPKQYLAGERLYER